MKTRTELRLAAAVVTALGLLCAGAPNANAAVHRPDGQMKRLGQLKNRYNHLCMDDGNKSYAGHPIAYERCRTVNGGYTTASQYFFLQEVVGGVVIHTHRTNICVGMRLSGNPTPGDDLVTAKCTRAANQIFTLVGGGDGVPLYFYAHNSHNHSTKYLIGVRTKSVGAHVAIGDTGRTSVSAWDGPVIEAH